MRLLTMRLTMGDLVVELYGQRLGTLRGDWRSFDLVPDPAAALHFGLDSTVLSIAVPLQVRSTRSRAPIRRNFFAELLPEGRMRTRLAQTAGVQEHDAIGLLRRFGRDVAGALQIWDPVVPGEPMTPRYEPVEQADVARMLTVGGAECSTVRRPPTFSSPVTLDIRRSSTTRNTVPGWRAPLP